MEPQITLNCPSVNGPFHQPYKSNLAQYKLAYWSMPHLRFTNAFFPVLEKSLSEGQSFIAVAKTQCTNTQTEPLRPFSFMSGWMEGWHGSL